MVVGCDLCCMCYAWLVLKQSHSSPLLDAFTPKLVRLPLQRSGGGALAGGDLRRAITRNISDRSPPPDLRNSLSHQQRSTMFPPNHVARRRGLAARDSSLGRWRLCFFFLAIFLSSFFPLVFTRGDGAVTFHYRGGGSPPWRDRCCQRGDSSSALARARCHGHMWVARGPRLSQAVARLGAS